MYGIGWSVQLPRPRRPASRSNGAAAFWGRLRVAGYTARKKVYVHCLDMDVRPVMASVPQDYYGSSRR